MFNALLPKRCSVCDMHDTHGFCADCRQLLPWIMTGCEICGTELLEVGVCGACQARRPYYDHAVIPFKYREPVSRQIQTLKYHEQLVHASNLGAMICMRVWKDPQPLPEVLIPVPLHSARLRQRGYNQAMEIARWVGKELGIEVNYKLLARVKNTASQTGLGEKERHVNMRGAFQATLPMKYARVGLVDDVVTSGSTVNAAARALKRAGVETVSVWAAART